MSAKIVASYFLLAERALKSADVLLQEEGDLTILLGEAKAHVYGGSAAVSNG
jgi:hypothetical protein